MWLSGSLIGSQKGPAIPARLKAQWRQTERENAEAIVVRRQWMALLGFSPEEIEAACVKAFDLDLVDELEQLAAAKLLSGNVQ